MERPRRGTVICSIDRSLSGGSKKTLEFAEKHNKPFLHVHRRTQNAEKKVLEFVLDNEIKTLNVAGSRVSKEPAIGDFVRDALDSAFPEVNVNAGTLSHLFL